MNVKEKLFSLCCVEDTKFEIPGAVIVAGVVISAGIITFVTAAMVTVCVVLKKKCGKKDQSQQQVLTELHTYESISLSPTKGSQSGNGIQEEPDRTTNIIDEDETVEYDDHILHQNVQESVQLTVNKAYATFNISAEPSTDL